MKTWELLSDESKWCQWKEAVDKDGHHVKPRSPRAVRWCLMGAVEKCHRNKTERMEIFSKIRKEINLSPITSWNDDHIRKFDEVRNLAKKMGI